MKENKSKKLTNTKEEYEDVLTSDDPTKISKKDLQELAKESIKKFKSLS